MHYIIYSFLASISLSDVAVLQNNTLSNFISCFVWVNAYYRDQKAKVIKIIQNLNISRT